jgi:co-chaperonin GroES (HSP10)
VSINIKPLEDRIVVKPLDAEQTTASGLVIRRRARSLRSARVASTRTATAGSRST